ncbi:hypothetical protein SBX64_07500 [Vibrio rhizosphaerae]|uniref:Uncharacterized protein n=1 Tax=Vibrio rhizosphaerae TaxID=398736 RepID=A0ABU4IVZ6_9VIBR|nr:hypothetical protein [Vibrio rhizosphaerae]MDW6092388.1 hypothetical protein [Vibrio rhizosphaerae]
MTSRIKAAQRIEKGMNGAQAETDIATKKKPHKTCVVGMYKAINLRQLKNQFPD